MVFFHYEIQFDMIEEFFAPNGAKKLLFFYQDAVVGYHIIFVTLCMVSFFCEIFILDGWTRIKII